jgi:hypothetical protein
MADVNFQLAWDQIGEKKYEAGIDRGVLYVASSGTYPKGESWSGLTGVTETPEGAEANDKYADNIKYGSIRSAETLKGTIKAYTYPDAWGQCNGEAEPATGISVTQQARKSFGLCYRTLIGNDTDGIDHGYKLHLVYGATASPSERDHQTINDSPDMEEMSWEFDTVPVVINTKVDGKTLKPSSHIIIDSTKVDPEDLATLEAALYGTAAEGQTPAVDAYLPLPDAVFAMFQ